MAPYLQELSLIGMGQTGQVLQGEKLHDKFVLVRSGGYLSLIQDRKMFCSICEEAIQCKGLCFSEVRTMSEQPKHVESLAKRRCCVSSLSAVGHQFKTRFVLTLYKNMAHVYSGFLHWIFFSLFCGPSSYWLRASEKPTICCILGLFIG